MQIIGLTGLPRSGKDTFAAHLRDLYGYRTLAFATPMKQAAAILLNREFWEMNGDHDFDREAILPGYDFSVRQFLQRMGTEVMRENFGADFWIKNMRGRLEGVSKAVITDVRFPNECELIKELGGRIVRIERVGCIDNGHISNAPMPADFVIENNWTLEDFYDRINTLVKLQHWD